MKRLSRKVEARAGLSESFHKQLNSYALAAGAAGVSMLALGQPADAKIIYTATHKVIGLSGRFNLDFDHSGRTDVTLFESRHGTSEGGRITHLFASAAAGNVIKGYRYFTSTGPGLNFASAMRKGQRIDATQTRFGYGGRNTMAAAITSPGGGGTFGAWGNIVLQPYRYLGVQFKIDGKIHYGWARLIVKCSGIDVTATLTGYAYETVANKGIVAGQKAGQDDDAGQASASPAVPAHEPASLGRLAQGFLGLAAWRRRDPAPIEAGE
jgi:hypothetical protein